MDAEERFDTARSRHWQRFVNSTRKISEASGMLTSEKLSWFLSDLEIFDLPVPIAIFIVIAWIFVCSATFCIWEKDWNYFLAFYFFFISLRYNLAQHKTQYDYSTIGLGDIVPSQPKYLLMLFIYIIIGLSLVSMCINLIQADSNG